ncbi:hypothetical protein D9M68_997020 [compost metagenome]
MNNHVLLNSTGFQLGHGGFHLGLPRGLRHRVCERDAPQAIRSGAKVAPCDSPVTIPQQGL